MTLSKFGKIVAISAATFSVAAAATAQSQSQSYQQQQAYYRAWQQYYQQYYSQYGRPSLFNRGRYTTQQPNRAGSWYTPRQQQQSKPEQPATPQPATEPQDEYPVVQSNSKRHSAEAIDLDARQSKKASAETTDNSVWYNSFDPAWQSAYEQGRPLVLLFVHQGCPECSRMDGYLSQPGAMDTLACAVKARIEFTENPATVSRFGVKFTPTFIVLSPQGNEAYREVGALDVNRLRQIQPALESLVAVPPKGDTAKAKLPAEAKNKVSSAPAMDSLPAAEDSATSQTIAAL